jgi:lipopolysaccharide assembly outer membrane protein LptD (OstA)
MRSIMVVLALAAVFAPTAMIAQTTERDQRARTTAFIERRLAAQQPVELAADTITLIGDVLRLKGHVKLVCGSDTFITAEEVTIDRSRNRVELIGNVHASWGRSSGMIGDSPRIQYR